MTIAHASYPQTVPVEDLPLDAGDLLLDELRCVRARRQKFDNPQQSLAGIALPTAASDTASTEAKLQRYYAEVRDLAAPLSALCLSGGGIRSAAFSLGVVQGLAKRDVLHRFDYLSTVSGGGYTGAFLTAWVHRAGYDDVLESLKGPGGVSLRSPLRHLRSYSNYLTPRTGLFSADMLTLVVLYVRNVLLNWLVILPLVIAAIAAVKLFAIGVWEFRYESWTNFFAILALTALGIAFVDSIGQRPGPHGETTDPGMHNFYRYEILPILAGSIFAALAVASAPIADNARTAEGKFDWGWGATLNLMLVGAVVACLAWLIASYFSAYARTGARQLRRYNHLAVFANGLAYVAAGVLSGALVALAIYGLWRIPESMVLHQAFLLVIGGPPTVIVALFIGEVIYVGLTSDNVWSDAEREWLARAAGHHFLMAAVWVASFAVVLYGSYLAFDLMQKESESFGQLWAALAGIGSISGAIAAWLGRAASTAAQAKERLKPWLDLPLRTLMAIATPIFTMCLVVLVSMLIDEAIGDGALCPPGASKPCDSAFFNPVAIDGYTLPRAVLALAAVLLGALVIGGAASFWVNINRFSMHGVYRNRLIRTFLGASHEDRKPNAFTDFDSDDNLDFCEVWPGEDWPGQGTAGVLRSSRIPPSLHVINMAMNIVGSTELAWQERKAVSFTATARWVGVADLPWREGHDAWRCGGVRPPPDYVGYFRPTHIYGDRLSIGTAMTISGAAANPNMGYHSSSAYSVLLTLFNVRLGAWLGNPRPGAESDFPRSSPRYAARSLLSEALGTTTEGRNFVYLSDGGHFENL